MLAGRVTFSKPGRFDPPTFASTRAYQKLSVRLSITLSRVQGRRKGEATAKT